MIDWYMTFYMAWLCTGAISAIVLPVAMLLTIYACERKCKCEKAAC